MYSPEREEKNPDQAIFQRLLAEDCDFEESLKLVKSLKQPYETSHGRIRQVEEKLPRDPEGNSFLHLAVKKFSSAQVNELIEALKPNYLYYFYLIQNAFNRAGKNVPQLALAKDEDGAYFLDLYRQFATKHINIAANHSCLALLTAKKNLNKEAYFEVLEKHKYEYSIMHNTDKEGNTLYHSLALHHPEWLLPFAKLLPYFQDSFLPWSHFFENGDFSALNAKGQNLFSLAIQKLSLSEFDKFFRCCHCTLNPEDLRKVDSEGKSFADHIEQKQAGNAEELKIYLYWLKAAGRAQRCAEVILELAEKQPELIHEVLADGSVLRSVTDLDKDEQWNLNPRQAQNLFDRLESKDRPLFNEQELEELLFKSNLFVNRALLLKSSPEKILDDLEAYNFGGYQLLHLCLGDTYESYPDKLTPRLKTLFSALLSSSGAQSYLSIDDFDRLVEGLRQTYLPKIILSRSPLEANALKEGELNIVVSPRPAQEVFLKVNRRLMHGGNLLALLRHNKAADTISKIMEDLWKIPLENLPHTLEYPNPLYDQLSTALAEAPQPGYLHPSLSLVIELNKFSNNPPSTYNDKINSCFREGKPEQLDQILANHHLSPAYQDQTEYQLSKNPHLQPAEADVYYKRIEAFFEDSWLTFGNNRGGFLAHLEKRMDINKAPAFNYYYLSSINEGLNTLPPEPENKATDLEDKSSLYYDDPDLERKADEPIPDKEARTRLIKLKCLADPSGSFKEYPAMVIELLDKATLSARNLAKLRLWLAIIDNCLANPQDDSHRAQLLGLKARVLYYQYQFTKTPPKDALENCYQLWLNMPHPEQALSSDKVLAAEQLRLLNANNNYLKYFSNEEALNLKVLSLLHSALIDPKGQGFDRRTQEIALETLWAISGTDAPAPTMLNQPLLTIEISSNLINSYFLHGLKELESRVKQRFLANAASFPTTMSVTEGEGKLAGLLKVQSTVLSLERRASQIGNYLKSLAAQEELDLPAIRAKLQELIGSTGLEKNSVVKSCLSDLDQLEKLRSRMTRLTARPLETKDRGLSLD